MTSDLRTGRIENADALRALVGEPTAFVRDKVRTRLSDTDRDWLAASPFVVVSTSDSAGRCDASPKGDPAGFVRVLDDRTVAIPERRGNRRVDGYLNVLENPHVGILSLIPGRGDTLRINGRAHLVDDAPWFEEVVVRGHRPVLALVVGSGALDAWPQPVPTSVADALAVAAVGTGLALCLRWPSRTEGVR